MSDPAYRFTVIYKDGREVAQEDEKEVVVRDHCHLEDYSRIKIYALCNRPGDHTITVNFENGDFSINSTRMKMLAPDIDMFLNPFHAKAVFKPIVGRRKFQGQNGMKTFFYCGWSTVLNGKTIKRVMYVDEHGELWLESAN